MLTAPYYTFQLTRKNAVTYKHEYKLYEDVTQSLWVLQDINQILTYYLKNHIHKNSAEIMGSLNENKINKQHKHL